MRFMAIIAFCLIAILALVRNAEPPPAPVAVEPAEIPTPDPIPDSTPRPRPVAVPKVVPDFADPLVMPLPVAPAPPETTPAPAPLAPQLPIVEVAVQVPVQPEQPTEPVTEEEGLSLRFASDRDFLRLVTKGEIQVFAFYSQAVLGLDRNFEFLDAAAPGQVYELLPETIPNLIVAALDRATAESASYTWGIRMPKKLEGKIRGFIDREVHGELVIDRYGEVHHVAS